MKTFIFLVFLVNFTNIVYANCLPAGTAGDDIVNCTGATIDTQYLFGGDDTVTLVNFSGNTTFWLDEERYGNPITDGDDRFYAVDSHFYWLMGLGGDDYFEINNSEFTNLYSDVSPPVVDQRGNDTVIIRNSISHGYILGGNDSDTITLIDCNVSKVLSGYSNVNDQSNWIVDPTPYDGNDTVILDNVNFTVPLYWNLSQTQGRVGAGKGEDNITFIHGGEAYYVYGGHGSDTIEIFDGEHFNYCPNSPLITHPCGIYGDEHYNDEYNVSQIPLLHGDDQILIHDAILDQIFIQGGDGSDYLLLEQPVSIKGTSFNGGDDTLLADGFIDRIQFEHWLGDLNGSQFSNWEQIYLHNASFITLLDNNISSGSDIGTDATSGLPYGVTIDDNSQLNIYNNFFIEANLNNNAILNLQDGSTSGTKLIIKNNYTATDGTIYLDTLLNNASPSISDLIIVSGSSYGTTTLFIENIGGLGGDTSAGNGIMVVEVLGNSNAIFELGNTLEAGEYWYNLQKRTDGNWYLVSELKVGSLIVTIDTNSTPTMLGDTLSYIFTVTNTGNVDLNNTTLSSVQCSNTPTLISESETADGILQIGETQLYSCTSTGVTQIQIDSGAVNAEVNATAVNPNGTNTPYSSDVLETPVAWSPPVATDDSYILSEYGSASDYVGSNDQLSSCSPEETVWILIQEPQHGTISLDSDGSYTYTPHTDFQGVDTVEYKIICSAKGLESNIAILSVNVTFCGCENMNSDSVISLNIFGILGMIASILVIAYTRREYI